MQKCRTRRLDAVPFALYRKEDKDATRSFGLHRRAFSGASPLSTRDLTLHQLRIFWAVAQSKTLTKAAKQLGLTQPSLSQQMAKLEANTGSLLFERRANEMTLTEAGGYLLPKVEQVLRTLGELEDGLQQFQEGKRMNVGVAGVNSLLRVLLPQALAELNESGLSLDFDILEAAPGEVLEYLYARRVKIGLLAANSVAEASVGFAQVPLLEDPYVLAVPANLALHDIIDPEKDLSPDQTALLGRAIQFSFGTQHTNQSMDWYDRVLPDHRIIARCRSFETALSLVRAGNGVCLSPLMAASGLEIEGITLYRFPKQMRRIVALVPTQYTRVEPYGAIMSALQLAAKTYTPPPTRDAPAWLIERAQG